MRFDTIHRYNDEIKRIDKALDDLKEDIEKHPNKTWNHIHYVLLHSMQESLKEERDRLKDLISYIKKRVKEREELSNEYFKVTSDFLEDLGEIKETEKLDVYKTRLNNIIEYLNNLESIYQQNYSATISNLSKAILIEIDKEIKKK